MKEQEEKDDVEEEEKYVRKMMKRRRKQQNNGYYEFSRGIEFVYLQYQHDRDYPVHELCRDSGTQHSVQYTYYYRLVWYGMA